MASSGRAGLATLGLGLTLLIGACQAGATPPASPTAPVAVGPGTPAPPLGPIFNPTPAAPARRDSPSR